MPRTKGALNRRTQAVRDQLEALKCDPIEGMAAMAEGRVPCCTCEGSGRARRVVFHRLTGTRYPTNQALKEMGLSLDDYGAGFMICPSCGGVGAEVVPLEIRAQMYKELGHYWAPKRKPVNEHVEGTDRLVLVTANAAEL